MNTRIERVINNHQLSCQANDKYFYILRGFSDFMDWVKIPVKRFDVASSLNENRYILEEDIDKNTNLSLDDFKYVEVVFNFFTDNQVYKDDKILRLDNLDMEISERICIFHQINQLDGISKLELTNKERLEFLKNIEKEGK